MRTKTLVLLLMLAGLTALKSLGVEFITFTNQWRYNDLGSEWERVGGSWATTMLIGSLVLASWVSKMNRLSAA